MLALPNISFSQNNSNDSSFKSLILCYKSKDTVEQPIHLEWVQIDKDIINNILNRLSKHSTTISEIQNYIPTILEGKCNCERITYNLGYGLKSTLYQIYGGYGSFNVDVIYYSDKVIKLRISIIGNYKELIEKYLLNEFQFTLNCSNEYLSFEKTNSTNFDNYVKDSGRLYIESNDSNIQRRNAINYFMNIMSGGTFKEPYYILEGVSLTFIYLQYFILNNDYKALESILFSPSPTSRLFAARTLIYMKEKFGYHANKKNKLRIKETIEKAEKIRSGVVSCWSGKFKYDYFDIIKDYDKLLMMQ